MGTYYIHTPAACVFLYQQTTCLLSLSQEKKTSTTTIGAGGALATRNGLSIKTTSPSPQAVDGDAKAGLKIGDQVIAASLGMNFGLLMSLASPKLPSRLKPDSVILSLAGALSSCNLAKKLADWLTDEYLCPQCRAPKKRFTGYDPETGKAIGRWPLIGVIVGLVAGLAGVGALLVYGLQ
ncbi:hypothetical protein L6452_15001 [Arctium lappa]|uniref:Uncharacterized protein n=1 Tax=Arctium lappa TaxID=4217 RepID=A0ACB9CMH7_ARCLA|nr:hypothetical protein L6452_15001 [Arctium lappa]